MLSESCEALTYAVFNQGLTYRWRNLTVAETKPFTNDAMVAGTEVEVLCGEIHESIIEACIFRVGDYLYVGDWNIRDYEGSCEPEDGTNVDYTPMKHSMMLLEIDGYSGELPSIEEYEVTVAMLAEVVAGSGTIYSRQQLALVLGVFSRLSGMKSGIGIGYHPETVVVVKASRFVLFLWVLLLAAGSLIHVRERKLGCKVFIPSKAWDWYAIGARESLGDAGTSGSEAPSDYHYLAKYGCLKSVIKESDGTVKRLSWIRPGRQEVEVLDTGGASNFHPPQSRRDSHAVDEAVDASRSVPRFVNESVRRSRSI
ncbi:unnamed protein product [Scytosiphon promiscuus]